MCAAPNAQLQLARQADAACIVVGDGGWMILQPGPEHLASLQKISTAGARAEAHAQNELVRSTPRVARWVGASRRWSLRRSQQLISFDAPITSSGL
jgi:hypothetical protein